jgi:hypothetical protein
MPVILIVIAARVMAEIAFPKTFAEPPLVCETRVLPDSSHGPVLQIVFRGGVSQQRNEMSRYVQEAITAHNPVGVVFDLLDVRHGFADDICPLLIPLYDIDTKYLLPYCVIANKRLANELRATWYRSLYPLGCSEKCVFTELHEGIEYLAAQLHNTA